MFSYLINVIQYSVATMNINVENTVVPKLKNLRNSKIISAFSQSFFSKNDSPNSHGVQVFKISLYGITSSNIAYVEF